MLTKTSKPSALAGGFFFTLNPLRKLTRRNTAGYEESEMMECPANPIGILVYLSLYKGATMGYIDQSLVANERACVRATISWLPFVFSLITSCAIILLTIFIAVMVSVGSGATNSVSGAACVMILFPFLLIPPLRVLIALLTTELTVTNLRIVGKTGWISRQSVEILLTKVESLGVQQGIWGRLFGYGLIQVRGTGGTWSHFPYIKNPVEFRRQFASLTHASQHPVPTATSTSSVPAAVQHVPQSAQPLFEVQVVDRATGAERWIDVRASTIEQAREKVAAAGEMVGLARLKSFA